MVYPYPQQVILTSHLFLPIFWGQVLFNGTEHGDLETRNQLIFKAFKLYAYTQPEIAAHLGLHKTTISKIASKPTEQTRHTIIHHPKSPENLSPAPTDSPEFVVFCTLISPSTSKSVLLGICLFRRLFNGFIKPLLTFD